MWVVWVQGRNGAFILRGWALGFHLFTDWCVALKKAFTSPWDTTKKVIFFFFKHRAILFDVPSMTSHSATLQPHSLFAVFLHSCWALYREDVEGAAGGVIFALEATYIFKISFPPRFLRHLNNYFLWDGFFFFPCSIPAWIYFLWKRERLFRSKNIALEIGSFAVRAKEIILTVQSLILGGISLLHGDRALRPKCTIPFMSTLATMADCATSYLCREAFTFWDLSSLTFEAWTLGEHPGVRFIPASTEL